ncbi:MAG: BON domain-containing protein [Nitrospirota bacterium]|nr:BON domain-containing protein [Nitrospirota bacterium]
MKKLVHIFLVVFSLSALVGCATPSGKSVGEAIDDSAIVAKANVEIFNDPELKVLRVNVDSYRGVVTLSGRVDSKEQEKRAMEIVQKVKGVSEVRSTLVVSPN